MPIPAFPALPSGLNPSLGAAAGFAQSATSAYAAGLQFATALRAAAAKRDQEAATAKATEDAARQKQEIELRDKGYKPYTSPRDLPSDASGRPTMMTPAGSDPAAPSAHADVDPSQLFTGAGGRQWVAPPPKPEATPQQTYADTSSLLEHSARPVDAGGNVPQDTNTPRYRMNAQGQMTDTGMFGINAPPPPGTTVTPPGGQQSYYVPPPDETLATKLRAENAAKAGAEGAQHVDTEHFSSPVVIDPKTGKATAIALPAGVTHNDKPDKPDKYTYHPFTDDNGKVTVTRIGEDGAQMWNGKAWAPLDAGARIGPQRKDPNAPPAPKTATPAQLNAVEGKKRAGLVRAEAAFKRALKDAKVGDFTDEEKVKDATETLSRAKQETQDAYEQSLAQFGVPAEHFEYGAVEPGPASTRTPQYRPGPATRAQDAAGSKDPLGIR